MDKQKKLKKTNPFYRLAYMFTIPDRRPNRINICWLFHRSCLNLLILLPLWLIGICVATSVIPITVLLFAIYPCKELFIPYNFFTDHQSLFTEIKIWWDKVGFPPLMLWFIFGFAWLSWVSVTVRYIIGAGLGCLVIFWLVMVLRMRYEKYSGKDGGVKVILEYIKAKKNKVCPSFEVE